MEFTIKKSDLLRELTLSQGVVEKRTTIPILSNVLLEANGDRITLTTTDLELAIKCGCPAQVKRPGASTIPAKRLFDFVRLLPDTDINFKLGDNQWAGITCGRSRTRIAGMSRDSYPELPEMSDKIADLPVSPLASMIAQTIFSISTEESRFTLNGALIVLKGDAMIMVSTDGHRLALTERNVELTGVGGFRALLPKKAMTEILKLASEAASEATIEFAATENHLFFRLGDRLLTSRKLTGNFPDYDRVLPKDHPHHIVLNRDELRGAIERVSQFADERSHAVRIKAAPGELTVHSSLADTGDSEENISCVYDGPEVEIGFNAQYMLEFLRACPQAHVEFHFRDGASAGEMRPGFEAPEDASNYVYRYIIMPMRI
jgi:DNA polymerase-3 subunit beta